MCLAGTMAEQIRENEAAHRYEILVDDELVGFTQYRDHDGVRDFTHTRVFEGWEGQGLGSRLIAGALADVRGKGLRIRMTCPMVKAFVGKHPEDQDLVG